MEPERRLWLCFLRGLNVFGRGTIHMSELERRCRATFAETGLPILLVDYYGSTGNVAVLATGVTGDGVRRALFQAIPKPCAVVQPELVDQVDRAFGSWPPPQDVPGFHWTCGVSLLCDGQPADGDIEDPNLGVFLRIAPGIVAIYRKERVTDHGRLDPADRHGGWAAVSEHTETVLGGLWTARSFDVLRKLLSQAHSKLASDEIGKVGAS